VNFRVIKMATIQSNGRIGVLQNFLFENKAALEQIHGIDIDRKKIGNSQGQVDDILGKGTSTALQSILVAAQLRAGVAPEEITKEFNDTTKVMLRDLLVGQGIEAEQVNQFIEDTVHISKGGELAHLYENQANAHTAAIIEGFEPNRQPSQEAKAPPPPPPPEEPETDDLPDGVGTPTEEKPGAVMRAEAPVDEKEVVPPTTAVVGKEVNIGGGLSVFESTETPTEETAVAQAGEEINIGGGFSITMDKEDAVAFAANTEVKTSEPAPVFEEYNIGGGFSVMACHVSGTELPPSPEEITKLFGDAVAHENPDVIGTYTVADVQGMKANDPSPFQQKIIEVVLGKHEERSESDKARQEQIAALREEQSAIGPAMNACIEDTIRAAMKIDDLDKAMVNAKFDFAATIDGKEVRFEDNTKTGGTDSRLSMQQIIDGDIPGISSPYLEPFDYKRVKEAGAEAFHNKMMTSEGYAALFNDYKGSLVRLEGADHVGELPNIAFKEHFDQLDLFDNLRHGEFMGGLRELNTSIAALEESTEQIKGDADSATYVVKQSDLDALANPTEVIAKQDATTPALPQV